MSEKILAYDTREPLQQHRLKLDGRERSDTFVDVREIRRQKFQERLNKEQVIELCMDHLRQALRQFKDRPAIVTEWLEQAIAGQNYSLPAVSAGLPGLGKR